MHQPQVVCIVGIPFVSLLTRMMRFYVYLAFFFFFYCELILLIKLSKTSLLILKQVQSLQGCGCVPVEEALLHFFFFFSAAIPEVLLNSAFQIFAACAKCQFEL